MIIPYIMENKKCLKPPTTFFFVTVTPILVTMYGELFASEKKLLGWESWSFRRSAKQYDVVSTSFLMPWGLILYTYIIL